MPGSVLQRGLQRVRAGLGRLVNLYALQIRLLRTWKPGRWGSSVALSTTSSVSPSS